MATREENIKKINEKLNEQLEQMSDEQLEKVAGGIIHLPDHFAIGKDKLRSDTATVDFERNKL